MLTTSFEKIRMKYDESFNEFYAKFNDILNSSFNPSEQIPKIKIVRKVLRSCLGGLDLRLLLLRKRRFRFS